MPSWALLVLTPPRAGWAEAFRAMAESGDDHLLDSEAVSTSEWDDEEWQW